MSVYTILLWIPPLSGKPQNKASVAQPRLRHIVKGEICLSNDIRPAQLLADVMSRIYRNGYTTTSGGNLSLRDEAGNVWMTPSGLDKGALRQEDMVCITPAGEIRGRTKPSCEFYFHLKIYELRPEIKAVVHAHPSILVSLSLTHRVPDPLITPLDWDGGSIGLCGFAVPGSQRLMEEVGEAFLHGCDSVIMANHGAIAASNVGLEDAYRRFESVIRAAEREYSAKLWDRPVALTGGPGSKAERASAAAG